MYVTLPGADYILFFFPQVDRLAEMIDQKMIVSIRKESDNHLINVKDAIAGLVNQYASTFVSRRNSGPCWCSQIHRCRSFTVHGDPPGGGERRGRRIRAAPHPRRRHHERLLQAAPR